MLLDSKFLWDTIAFENIHVVAIHDPCKQTRQLKQLILFSKHLITNFRRTGREPWWTQTWWCHHLPLVAGRGGRKCGDAAWMKWNYFVSEVFLNSLCRSWGSIIYMERPRFLQRHSWRTACAELGVESFSWSGPVVPRQIFGEHGRWQHCRNWRTVACTVSWWPVRVCAPDRKRRRKSKTVQLHSEWLKWATWHNTTAKTKEFKQLFSLIFQVV